jgi:hypothetical protein
MVMPAAPGKISAEDRLAITDAVHRFFALVDGGKAASTADIFTADASLTFGPGSPNPGTIEGAEIGAAMVAREAQVNAFTRHCISNLQFVRGPNGTVQVSYIMILFRSDDATRSSIPSFVADAAEEWVASEGVWRLASRIVTPTFSKP